MVSLSWQLQEIEKSQIVKKHQTSISDEIEEKILSMYALGMSYKDIVKHIIKNILAYLYLMLQ